MFGQARGVPVGHMGKYLAYRMPVENSHSALMPPLWSVMALLCLIDVAVWADEEETKPLPYSPTAVQVISFDADKMLYDVGEPVIFRCVLRFASAGPALKPLHNPLVLTPFAVEVWDEHGVDPPVKVAEAKLQPDDPTKPSTVELRWQPGDRQYGHQAHLRVLDSGGRRLAEASTLYEVCRDWQYVIRMAATMAMHIAGQDMDDADRQRIATSLRKGCANTVELYQALPHSYDFTPDTPTWKAEGYPEPHNPRVSGQSIERLGEVLRANGIRMVVYNETSVLDPEILDPDDDPEAYRVYLRNGAGKLKPHAPYLRERGFFQPNVLKITDRFTREVRQSVERFGWDGILADSATQSFYSTANGFDAHGNRLTDLTPGEVGNRYFTALRQAVLPVNGRFRILSQNIASSMLLRNYHFRTPDDKIDEVTGNYMRQHFGELFDAVDGWSAEMDPHFANQEGYPQTYDKYAVVLNIGREVSGRPILLWMHVSNPHTAHEYSPEYVRPLLSVLAASRANWHDHFSNWGGWWGPWRNAPVNRVQVQIHRFVARFGRYLRAPELRWVRRPEEILEVSSSRPLFWKRTVYQRDYADGTRELTVNLINLDSEFVRPANQGLPPHKKPPVAFPVTVRYRLPEGAGPESLQIFAMDAEDAALRPLELQPTVSDGKASVQVPPVRSWQMLVIGHVLDR